MEASLMYPNPQNPLLKLQTRFLLLGLALSVMLGRLSARQEDTRPNIVFFFADDLGWAQTGAYGSEYYHTPNIDRLAREGVRFTDAYAAAPICSPTRASLMTGKYTARLNLTNFIPGYPPPNTPMVQPRMQLYLPVEEFTLGNLFSEEGYPSAMFGKWHLSRFKFGPASLPTYPDKQGFTHSFVIDKPDVNTQPEMDPHWSDMIGNRSVEFIHEHADQPFFLFMSFSAIHDPLIESAEAVNRWLDHPGTSEPENNPIIAAILERLDRNVGLVLDALEEAGLTENTLVIFYSDNGGLAENNVVYFMNTYPEEHRRDNALTIARQTPLREGKGWLYEGGIRVPLIMKWPGVIEAGRVSPEIVNSYDFLPTFSDILGRDLPGEVDGVSLLSHLKTGEPLPERNHYWHFPHYRGQRIGPSGVVRSGNWKLIEWYERTLMPHLNPNDPPFELYDLENDLGETTNLAERHPDITRKLAEDLKAWRERVDAQMPTPR